jgi:hypothetical protein
MLFCWNLNTDAITRSLRGRAHLLQPVDVIGGQGHPLELQFHRDGVAELLAEDTAIVLGIKKSGEFEGDPLARATAWTRPATAAGFYTATLSTKTNEIDAALGIDGTTANDVAAIDNAIAGFDYLLPAAELPVKSRTFAFRIENYVNQDGDAAPTSALAHASGRSAIGNAVDYFDVVFSTAFAAAPRLAGTPCVEKAAGGDDNIFCLGVSGLTTTGFRAHLSAATGSAGYTLHWLAFKP